MNYAPLVNQLRQQFDRDRELTSRQPISDLELLNTLLSMKAWPVANWLAKEIAKR